MSRLTSNPAAGKGVSYLILALASQMELAGQPEQASEHAFGQLVHPPVIVQPDAATPSISRVALALSLPETFFDSYEFQAPGLRTGSVETYAVRGELPSADWEY